MSNWDALLKTIKFSELGEYLIGASDNGYNVLVGSNQYHVMLFYDYSKHPRILNSQLNSTAAGAYQIIYPTYFGLCKNYGFSDFEPATQDAMALKLIQECGANAAIEANDFETAIIKCATQWASLPGSNAGQHVNLMSSLKDYYLENGGIDGGQATD